MIKRVIILTAFLFFLAMAMPHYQSVEAPPFPWGPPHTPYIGRYCVGMPGKTKLGAAHWQTFNVDKATEQPDLESCADMPDPFEPPI
jgi:hypothetical protein